MRSETVRGALRDGGRQPLSGGKGRMVSPHSTRRTPRSTTSISGQSGPQTDFLSTPADICIYGDAAGGGKTVGLILEQLRHAGRVAGLTAVVLPAHDAANHQSGRALG